MAFNKFGSKWFQITMQKDSFPKAFYVRFGLGAVGVYKENSNTKLDFKVSMIPIIKHKRGASMFLRTITL